MRVSRWVREQWGGLGAGLVLLALTFACFGRLAAQPGALLVDPDRASIDRAQHDDFRPPGNDLTFLYLPHYRHVAEEIGRHGRLPQWDTRGFGGRPLVGNPQGGLFYPPVWLAWWSRSPATLGWLTVGHLLGAALGLFLLMRDLGVGRPAATVSAGCLLMSPHIVAQVFEGHYPHVWAACWYPWAFRSYRRLRDGRLSTVFVLAPILALSLLAGHPQEWYYLTVALSFWVVADAASAVARGNTRGAFRLLASWGLVLVMTLGLAGVELLPDIAAQPWTLRGSRLASGKVTRYQLHALNLFQLLDPRALGGPADYFGRDNYWETVLSLGLVPLLLATIAAAYHPDRRLARGWLVLVAGALVFASGRKLGLFALLFDVLPGMNRFRVPARSLFLGSLGASALAGLGVETLACQAFTAEHWIRLGRSVRKGALLVIGSLLLLLPLAGRGTVGPMERPDRPLSLREIRTLLRSEPERPYRGALAAARVLRSGTFWLAMAGSAVVLAAACRRPDRRAGWALSLGLLGLVELALHGHAVLHVAPAERFLGPDPISAVLHEAQPARSGPFRIRARDPLYTDLNASSNGFEKININDSFQIQHAADLYETLYPLLYVIPPPNSGAPMSEVAHRTRHLVRQGVLDRSAVAFLVSDHVEPESSWPLVARGSIHGSTFAVHRNPTAMPRAYVVPRAQPTRDDVASLLCELRTGDPRESVLMPSDPLGDDAPRQPFTPARWCSDDPDRVVVEVSTEAPGLLVIADTWMPGWTATVNGRPAPLLRGNHSQRVVPLERRGTHRVVLRYRAPGLAGGLALTALSGCICAAGVSLGTIAERRRRRTPSRLAGPHPGDLPGVRSTTALRAGESALLES